MKLKGKTIFCIILCCILVCYCSFGVTYSYLITSDEAVNTMKIGEIKTEINERYDPPKELKPGLEIQKAPYVTNTGNLPCYVRMRADFSTSKAKSLCENLDIGSNWEYDANDGYYYYKKLLGTDDNNNETEPLFTTVKIVNGCEKADLIGFDILLYAEAVQSTAGSGGNSNNAYKTAFDNYHK